MAARRIQRYTSETIDVTFDAALCIHSARCLQSLPEVFDVRRRTWIELEAGTPDDIATAVRRCPSGALQYLRRDAPGEAPPAEPSVRSIPDGPLYVRGDIEVLDAEGAVVATGTRFALCRCGQSGNKPFCDNSHRAVGFRAL